jgi:hypothetical protein
MLSLKEMLDSLFHVAVKAWQILLLSSLLRTEHICSSIGSQQGIVHIAGHYDLQVLEDLEASGLAQGDFRDALPYVDGGDLIFLDHHSIIQLEVKHLECVHSSQAAV